MTEVVTFRFRSLQRVKIVEVEAQGFVSSRQNNTDGSNEYKVTYWMDAKRCDGWFFEFELEAA